MQLTDGDIKNIRRNPHLLGNLVGKEKLTSLHSRWFFDTWFKESHCGLQGHRGSYKTTALTIIGTIHHLLFYPDDRIAIIRNRFTDAADCLENISLLMKTPELIAIFSLVHGIRPKTIVDRKEKITFNFKKTKTPEGNINAYGIDTGITGRHFDRIICDDIVTLEDRVSRAKRERTKNVLREIVSNIIDPGKQVIHIGTPWHKDDAWSLTDTIPVPVKYSVYVTKILKESEILQKKQQTTGSLFAANYELKHVMSENALFTDAIYERWDYVKTGVVGHLDAKYSGEDTNALTLMYRRSDGKIHAIGFSFTEHIDQKYDFIVAKCKKYFCGTIYNERNSDKEFLAKELRKRGLIVESYHENINKHVKIVTHLKKEWCNIVWDVDTDPEYMNQILDYIEGQAPDDAPDSAASLICQKWGSSSYFKLYDL